jgi:6-pyruvoyltetrahydropterin/6-carboxytetrahydropterin synthase
MNVVLDYRSVSLEKLFEDWGVHSLGLRGAATGELTYSWNKDLVLEGKGRGRAQLQPGAVAFGDARYPLPLSGTAIFALNRGVVTFAPSTLRTKLSDIQFAGSFAIESTVSDLRMNIRSRDFTELDRILAPLVARLDHQNLNDIPPFDRVNPTAEAIAEWFYRGMVEPVSRATEGRARLSAVRLWETPDSWVVYSED